MYWTVCTLRIKNCCVSFQFSSRCSKVKGDSSDPERLGKMVKHCFLQEFSLIRFICLREKIAQQFYLKVKRFLLKIQIYILLQFKWCLLGLKRAAFYLFWFVLLLTVWIRCMFPRFTVIISAFTFRYLSRSFNPVWSVGSFVFVQSRAFSVPTIGFNCCTKGPEFLYLVNPNSPGLFCSLKIFHGNGRAGDWFASMRLFWIHRIKFLLRHF